MKIVREEENRSIRDEENNYSMDKTAFTIVFLAVYQSADDITDFCNKIPCSDQMDKYIVE